MVSFSSFFAKLHELVRGHAEIAEASLLFDRRGDQVSVSVRDAVVVLLVGVALADGFIAREEIQAIVELVRAEFGVSIEAAKILLERVTTDSEVPSVEQLTAVLSAAFDTEQRAQVCVLLQRVAEAEGGVHKEEQRLVSRVQQLLAV